LLETQLLLLLEDSRVLGLEAGLLELLELWIREIRLLDRRRCLLGHWLLIRLDRLKKVNKVRGRGFRIWP
jgi:hypothetical protein